MGGGAARRAGQAAAPGSGVPASNVALNTPNTLDPRGVRVFMTRFPGVGGTTRQSIGTHQLQLYLDGQLYWDTKLASDGHVGLMLQPGQRYRLDVFGIQFNVTPIDQFSSPETTYEGQRERMAALGYDLPQKVDEPTEPQLPPLDPAAGEAALRERVRVLEDYLARHSAHKAFLVAAGSAVFAFQYEQGLPATGTMDEATQKKLVEILGA